MAQLRKPTNPMEIKTVTKDGECVVNIKLDIVVHLEGGEARAFVRPEEAQEKDEDRWAIPDFGDTPHIDFGKKV